MAPTALNLGSTTLGTVAGPASFTLSNTSATTDTVNIDASVTTGNGANDFFGFPETSCPTDANGNIVLAATGGPNSTCTVDVLFAPSGLGTRNATLSLADSQTSGATVNFTGVGTIGYYQVSSTGVVAPFGDAGFFGDLSGQPLNRPIVGIAQTGDDGGYWLAASDGGIFNYGDAPFLGSAGGLRLNKPIVGMSPTTDGAGYWLVATDGGIFSYGDAQFYGSTGSIHLNQPIVGHGPDARRRRVLAGRLRRRASSPTATPSSTARPGPSTSTSRSSGWPRRPTAAGTGWSPPTAGSSPTAMPSSTARPGRIHLNQPIVGMAAMPDGAGYWFTAADGGLFNYGSAPFFGAAAGQGIGTVVGMASSGSPTLQAFLDVAPNARAHAGGAVPFVRPLPAGLRHKAGS